MFLLNPKRRRSHALGGVQICPRTGKKMKMMTFSPLISYEILQKQYVGGSGTVKNDDLMMT